MAMGTAPPTDSDLSAVKTPDDALALGMRIDGWIARMRELKAAWEECMIALIRQHGEIVNGDLRYYIGTDKTTKATDQQKVLETLMDKLGGDIELVCSCLSANAWKPGACRKLLPPESFDALFVTTEKPDLLTGKPKRGLQKVDQRFIK